MKFILFITGCLFGCMAYAQPAIMSLNGKWKVRLDSLEQGEKKGWHNEKTTSGVLINLPGTLDEAGLGEKSKVNPELKRPVVDQLTRKYSYIGPAWYSRNIVIPEAWKNRQIILTLERVIWKTEVWVDGTKSGDFGESLVAPHVFDLTSLMTPGTHTLTICVDNRKQYDVSLDSRNFAHAYTEGTQVIWNGILGNLTLQSLREIYFNSVQVFPNYDSSHVRLEINLVNITGRASKGTIEFAIPSLLLPVKRSVSLTGKNQKVSLICQLNRGKINTWDEFHPSLYNAQINIHTKINDTPVTASKVVTFGFRKLGNSNAQLSINNRRLFLRGTLECAIFPLAGHPPMDSSAWERIFRIAKSYGLNHLRFHSWCPPEAAFRAADKLGFYLQTELPFWSLTAGKEKSVNKFLKEEALRIIQNYGNHPSFCFWSMGNELEGDFEWLQNMVEQLKKEDNRHLYTTTTFSFQKGHGKFPEPTDDYFITQYTDKGWVRGQGIFNTNTPDFKTDYSKAVEGIPVPLIIHEVGQHSVYPDLKEITNYTGVLDPVNFKAIRHDLQKKDMLKLAEPYLKASGMLSANLYKEEIERALKTGGVSGFQLLDLHDFPGQGTALVGLLNAFWDSKGIITPAEFSRFCGPVVPLLRFDKAAFTNTETFTASAEVANFSDKVIDDLLIWSLSDTNNKVLFSGKLNKQSIAIGNGQKIGTFEINLSSITSAQQLTISLRLASSQVSNHWKIWVYPSDLPKESHGVLFTTSPDSALSFLKKGAGVILNPDTARIEGVNGRFAPVFWSPVHFPNQPGSMGLLINKNHPALTDFPTDFYSDWQWWDLVTNSRSVITDSLSVKPDPIVRVIDNFFKNRNMADLTEFKVGEGRLILCTMDIHHKMAERPAARQLRYSLMKYAASDAFKPFQNLSVADFKKLFK